MPSVGVALTERPIFQTYTPIKLPHPPQCVDSALKGKRVCRTYGIRSTVPKTKAGCQRCSKARTVHGRETSEAFTEGSLASARLAVLEEVGFSIGLMSGGRNHGVKPNRMAEAYPKRQKMVPRMHLKVPTRKLSSIEFIELKQG